MKRLINIATLGTVLALSACAGVNPFGPKPVPGDTAQVVIGKIGRPNASYPLPDGGQLLEYTGQPMGQFAYMARIGPDGRLVAYEQVLTSEKFATLKIDKATKDDVLRAVGHPAETSRVALHDYEVWSYRYKEAGVWNSMMHVHFDQNGVVRQMLNGPDPRYDDRYRRN
jgi:hypothetical protein